MEGGEGGQRWPEKIKREFKCVYFGRLPAVRFRFETHSWDRGGPSPPFRKSRTGGKIPSTRHADNDNRLENRSSAVGGQIRFFLYKRIKHQSVAAVDGNIIMRKIRVSRI